jgi:chitinase
MAARVGLRRTSDWGAGFVAQVTIGAEEALAGWTLAFEARFDIVNIWGAEIVSRQGDRYLLRAAEWTAQVAAGGTVAFGFQAATPVPAPDPAEFLLGGPILPGAEPPVLSVADVVASEGAGAFATFVLTLSAASREAVTVAFRTAEGSARAGADFRAAGGSLTFAPGETRKELRIALADNAQVEAAEAFSLLLSGATGATLARDVATATVLDDDAPRISVADAAVTEGTGGVARLDFVVTLSHAVATTVVVRVETADGSATAGRDYGARGFNLAFRPGETSKTVTVNVNGDRLVEPEETMLLRLSGPQRGVLVDAEAVGTIRNDDLPRIAVADAAPVTEGDRSPGEMHGALSTRGNQIVDATGAPVRIAAVNWFGMETASLAPHGLWARNWQEMMREMAELGFNAIRLPFSAQAILEGGMPNGIDPLLNPDLIGLSPIRILDAIVAYAGEIGLRVILDHHRSTAGNGPNPNGLWHDGAYTEARWIGMWEELAARYRGNPAVIGADLQNEPHGATWDAWAAAAERAGNGILAANPDWLVIVEGVSVHAGQGYWWGGNLMGAAERPVVLNQPGKLVYSPHDYPATVHPQPWFHDPAFPANMPAIFDGMWGHLWREGTAPLLVGEFGTRLEQPRDRAWLEELVAYLAGDTDGDGKRDVQELGPSFAWWSWNPNSGDTGGILADDWRTVNRAKLDALAEIMPPPATGDRHVTFTVALSAPAPAPVAVGWRTLAGSAGEADYVAAAGTLVFAPGERSRTVEVALLRDDLAEAEESFRLELTGAEGAAIADGIGVARILDDDWLLA